ncbi:MAG: queuosine precursor transporter [Pseudomonadota bacterium]
MTRSLLPAVLAMATVVVASNILVQFLLLDGLLTWGAFTYPFAFLVTDLTNRLLGRDAARKVVFAGFAVGIGCSLVLSQIQGEFGPLTTVRIATGSGIAFLVAQLVDVIVFNRLRDGAWWRAPLASTLIGSTLDTALFFSIAFSGAFVWMDPSEPNGWAREAVPLLLMGPQAPLWVSLAIADWGVKLAIALVALVPFGMITRRTA